MGQLSAQESGRWAQLLARLTVPVGVWGWLSWARGWESLWGEGLGRAWGRESGN